MLWILISVFLLIILLAYGFSTFVPHSTNMCVIDVDRSINDCFALANQPDNYAQIQGLSKVEFNEGSFSEKGSRGKIKAGLITAPFEMTEFIPNYRIALSHQNSSEDWSVQLSFYRLSKTSCRLVVIAKVVSSSRWQRLRNALGKNLRDSRINEQLALAKAFLEQAENVPDHFEDVSAEENPNFSLQ